MGPLHIDYIAAGTLIIPQNTSNLDEDQWASPELRTWRWLSHHDDRRLTSNTETDIHLTHEIQALLLKSSPLIKAAKLFRARWLRLEFCVNREALGCLRVHLLPDDVHRGSIDRTNPGLRKARQALMEALDYSKERWNDIQLQDSHRRADSSGVLGLNHILQRGEAGGAAQLSLLQLFNNIPSPNPSPEDVLDSISRDAMLDLLDSNVHGLKTELYPYQRRSAALMLQKEVQPGQTVDPRLQKATDQNGKSWYFDSVSGTILSEPRYYDGISGGILAEEMGSGKTIICLALILASRGVPTKVPELYGISPEPVRQKMASLVDMAAACATRHAVPWRPYLDAYGAQGWDFGECLKAMDRNPGYYYVPPPEPRRGARHAHIETESTPPEKVYLSSATLVVVPNNLVAQWRQEIQKHTKDLSVLAVTSLDEVPHHRKLLNHDIILFAQTRFETLVTSPKGFAASPLARIHFKRCIIDEGHKLGNSKIGKRSNLLIGLDHLRFDSRWVVTGTPSHGLFGIEDVGNHAEEAHNGATTAPNGDNGDLSVNTSSSEMEKKDLERIGSMAALFLKARPWANSVTETGDSPADWDTYLMLPKHKKGSHGRWDSLRTTLNSLIIRHRLDEVSEVLPSVNEKVVILDGSYQDRLSMNIFSMMIIFNSVQSQRTDMDYFFHPKQRRSLLQIVHNLKQSSFFGGSFFTASEIAKSVETAEEFLLKKDVPISADDEVFLRQAISLGRAAVDNSLRNLSNQFHEMPVCVEGFPGGAGHSWALGEARETGDAICTSASLLLALQKLVYGTAGAPDKFNALLNGGFAREGMKEKQKILDAQLPPEDQLPKTKQSQTLAGNTKLGGDSPHKSRSHGINGSKSKPDLNEESFIGPLEATKVLATVSAKMSYLLDQIIKHQDEEKILIFYENENVAWYLASMLDVVRQLLPVPPTFCTILELERLMSVNT